METSFILNILYNVALLLGLSILYDYSWIRQSAKVTVFRYIQTGILIGGIGIILILTPWTLSPGTIFDTRSILLSLSGLFFGPVPTVIAMLMTGIARLVIGGDGMYMGLAVIISSGSLGIAWRYLRSGWIDRRPFLELLALGWVVHIVMLGCAAFLPRGQVLDTIRVIVLPTLLIYPLATVLLGGFMLRMYRNSQDRKSRKTLLDTEHKLADLLENVSMLAVMIDDQGKVLYCNRYLLETTGYKREDIIGKSWLETFIPEEMEPAVSSVMSRVMSGKEAIEKFENNIRCRDGSEITVAWNNTVLHSEDGTIIGGASIGDNVTQKRIDEEQLLEAKSRAEESDRLKSIFLSNVSHEIRTPMNAILGFSNILVTDEIGEGERKKFLSIIQGAGKRLMHIVDTILDLSKIEAQQFKVRDETCDIYSLLYDTYETYYRNPEVAARKEIALKFNVHEKLKGHNVTTDRYRLRQVLDNLVTNALKYTKEGTVIIGSDSTPADQELVIYVRDSGIGIPEHIGNLVFERFRQVEENEFHEGVGLGLSISKLIIEHLGGTIWYDSVMGKGSTFKIAIPNQVIETAPVKGEGTADRDPDLSGRVICIADDDEDSRVYLDALLKPTHASVVHAPNGRILMDILARERPEIVLMDLGMPAFSGEECLQMIREKALDTKVIVQSAWADNFQQGMMLEKGAKAYLVKPIDRKKLMDTIRKII